MSDFSRRPDSEPGRDPSGSSQPTESGPRGGADTADGRRARGDRADAQRRVNRIRAFRAELETLVAAGVMPLSAEQRDEIARYHDRVLLGWARAGGDVTSTRWRALAELPQRWTAPKFPLKAADFIARGMAEGPRLGHVLTLAEDAWLAADFPLDDAALAAIADQAAARVSRDERT